MATPPAAGSIHGLIRRLVREAGTSVHPPASREPSVDTHGVILDVEVEGVRCLLVRPQPKSSQGKVLLSPREQEIVRLVAEGHPNKVIADVLEISSWTVATHLRRIFAKLSVGSRAAMVAKLLEQGVVGTQQRPIGPAHSRTK